MTNGRKCQNLIPGFNQDGRLVSEPKEIGRLFVSRFQQQFGIKCTSRFKVDLQKLLEKKQHVDLTDLERPFTMEEIREAVFSLGGTKPREPMVSRCFSSSNFGKQSKMTFSYSAMTSMQERLTWKG